MAWLALELSIFPIDKIWPSRFQHSGDRSRMGSESAVQIEDTRTFGQAIRMARRHRQMTQRELALVAGTGERFVVEPQRDDGDSAP